jgi:hypothetical protein
MHWRAARWIAAVSLRQLDAGMLVAQELPKG